MQLGKKLIREFNKQQPRIFDNFIIDHDYLECDLNIGRMFLNETILLESNYLHQMITIMNFENSVNHIVTKYLPEYRTTNEMMNEGVLSDAGGWLSDWYGGLDDLEKQDLHVDLGVTAVGAIGGIFSAGAASIAAGLTGVIYYLYRAITTYNQGYKFEAIVHLISSIFSIGQAFPAAGAGVMATKTLFIRAITSPLQTIGKMLVKSQGLVKSSAEGLTSNVIKMFRPGSTSDKLEKAAELLKTNQSFMFDAMSLLKQKLKEGENSPFVKMLNEVMSAKGQKFDINDIEGLTEQAEIIMKSLVDSTGTNVKRGEKKYEIVKNLINASEKANMTDVTSARSLIDAIDMIKGSSKNFVKHAERLNIQQGKFDELLDLAQKETLSQDEAANLYRELVKSRDLYEETLQVNEYFKYSKLNYDKDPFKFKPDDLATRRFKSEPDIEVKDMFGRTEKISAPGSFANQLKYMDDQILALEKRFDISQEAIDAAAPQIKRQAMVVLSAKRALKTTADEFAESFFDIAKNHADDFSKEFCNDLSNISGYDVIGPLPAKPGEPLKLAVRKKDGIPFSDWVKSADIKDNLIDDYLKGIDIKKSGMSPAELLDIQDDIQRRVSGYEAMPQGSKDNFINSLVDNSEYQLKQKYAETESLVDELNFDQFIYEHVRSKGKSLHEVLQDNSALNKAHNLAMEETKVIQTIKNDFLQQAKGADTGTAAYLAKQKMYDDYFYMMDTGRKKDGNITDFDKTISNFHYYLSEKSILAEFWKESIPNRYTLFIKKLGFNLLSDPVVEFINDDFTSFGELEIIDDSLLDSLNDAANAAIDMIPSSEE
jgi:hypothetical protein